jgi:hypothetical protein
MLFADKIELGVVEQKLTFQLAVLDKPNHVLAPEFDKRHNIWLAKGACVVELSLGPFRNKS